MPEWRPFYTTKQVADLFQVTTETVRNWIKAGQLEAITINGFFRVSQEAIDAFAEKRYGAIR